MALLCALLPTALFSASAENATSGTCGENLTWSFDTETGVLSITGSGNMDSWGWADATPWSSFRESIQTVIISDSVTSIGASAFAECSSLTSVTIPSSVTSIGGCNSFGEEWIDDGIHYNVFEYCDCLTSIMVDKNNPYYSSDASGVLFNKNKTELERMYSHY